VRWAECDRRGSMNTNTLARASDADFELITDWHIGADIYAVWQALNHPDY